MLKRILPMSVIQRLQQGQSMIADAHDEVTVLFAVRSMPQAGALLLPYGPSPSFTLTGPCPCLPSLKRSRIQQVVTR